MGFLVTFLAFSLSDETLAKFALHFATVSDMVDVELAHGQSLAGRSIELSHSGLDSSG